MENTTFLRKRLSDAVKLAYVLSERVYINDKLSIDNGVFQRFLLPFVMGKPETCNLIIIIVSVNLDCVRR